MKLRCEQQMTTADWVLKGIIMLLIVAFVIWRA